MKLIRHIFRAPAQPVRLPKYSCSDCGWSVERALVDPERIHCERCGGNAERVRRGAS